MNAANDIQHLLLNVIVWSNYPDDVFANELGPKLAKLGVKVIDTFKPDRVPADAVDASHADVVILFTAFMSHPQQDTIKRKAKTWGKSVVLLERQSSGWAELLEPFMPKQKSFGAFLRGEREIIGASLKDVAEKTKATVNDVRAWEADESRPPKPQMSRLRILFHKIVHHPDFRREDALEVPTPEESSPVSASPLSGNIKSAMSTYRTLTCSNTPEDEILEALRSIWRPELESLAEAEDLFDRAAKTDKAPSEFRTWWEDRKRALAAPPPPPPEPETEVEVLKRQLHETQIMEKLYQDENKRLQDDLKALVAARVHDETKPLHDELAKTKESLRRTLQQYNGAQGAKAAAEQRCAALEEDLAKKHVSPADKIQTKNLQAELAGAKKDYEQKIEDAKALQGKLHKALDAATAQEQATRADFAAVQADFDREKSNHENTKAALMDRIRQLEVAEVALGNAKQSQGGTLDKIGTSLKTLFDAKMLTRDEIGSKLATLLLGEKS